MAKGKKPEPKKKEPPMRVPTLKNMQPGTELHTIYTWSHVDGKCDLVLEFGTGEQSDLYTIKFSHDELALRLANLLAEVLRQKAKLSEFQQQQKEQQ